MIEGKSWIEWFIEYYGDSTTGDNLDPKDDMAFSRNKILCGIADELENIYTTLEKWRRWEKGDGIVE
jgi:hypothetical protein